MTFKGSFQPKPFYDYNVSPQQSHLIVKYSLLETSLLLSSCSKILITQTEKKTFQDHYRERQEIHVTGTEHKTVCTEAALHYQLK